MLRTIVWKELLEHLLSLRFAICFALIVGLFAVGGLAWNVRYAEEVGKFRAGEQEAETNLKAITRGREGLFNLASGGKIWRPPSPAGFLSGGYSHSLPNVTWVSISGVGDLEQKADRNPLLFRRDLDWAFIVGLLGTLLALLLTYDGVAGEKERGSLRQTLANQVPRDVVLWGKYLAGMAVIAAPVLVGAAVALLTVAGGSTGGIPEGIWGSVLGVLAGGLLCISAFVWLGLFVSSRAHNSSFALLVSLVVWVVSAVFVPNSGGILGNRLAPVPSASEVQRQIDEVWRTMLNGPEEDAALRHIREDYWRRLVRQIEVAQQATQLSPVAAYRYLGEALCNAGALRFRAFIGQAGEYRRQLYDFVEREDAQDSESSHELMPGHMGTISEKPVQPEEIPRFRFQEAPLEERLELGMRSAAVLLIYNLVFFAGAYWSFRRYDVR